jgi:hypothetical protein
LPNSGFLGLDSMEYRLCNNSVFSYCDEAWIYLNVDYDLSVSELETVTMNLFPNPSQGYVTARFSSGIDAYRIMDATGKVVRAATLSEAIQTVHIDLTGCSSGLYIFTAMRDGGQISQKLVIE